MRCGLFVDEQEVVAVVLGDIEDALTHTLPDIRTSLHGTYGTTCKKDFLRPTSDSLTIQRGKNDRKRRCFAFFMKHIPQDLVELLKQGNKMWRT